MCPTRSGSNLLVNLLSSHQRLRILGEIFSLDRIALDEVESIIDFPIEYLNKKLDPKSDLIHGVGFKMLYDNFKLDYFNKEVKLETSNQDVEKRNLKLIDFVFSKYSNAQLEHQFDKLWDYYQNDKDLRIIHLTRRNLLKTFVSLKRAFITDEWISIKDRKVDNLEIEISKEELETYFNRIVGFNNYYNEFFSEHQIFKLEYEDMVSDIEGTMENVLNFLGLEPVKLTSVLKKQNKARLRDNIKNYEELKMHFSSTQWSGFFED
ncbi:sulfotransferase [Gaetbulibacter jejuensis]|uniref:sulfotransferase n=1 Tax=Gaetbulibacter jejuensis TaxID=584607 RepID=UPI0031D6A1CC